MKSYSLYLFLLIILSSCATLPKTFQAADETIKTGPGPEDMVLDTISENARLLISCNERRGTLHYGEINVYYPATGQVKILKRAEPKEIFFNPHGIDLVQVKDTLVLLVVNHNHTTRENAILRYRVYKDSLVFLTKITDPLISSPNAVTGLPDGSLLVSNDSKKAGNFWEPLLMLKRAQIVYWNYNSCSVASEKYCYSNGITNRNNKVYLASTRQNKVWQFDFENGKMLNRQVIAKLHGPDNLRFDGNNLTVACHLRFGAFLKHRKDSTVYSPSTVYRINSNHTTDIIYYDSGAQLSAGATGLVFKNYVYVCGVFDPKISRRPLK